MPFTSRQPDAQPRRYTMAELLEVRRYVLRHARRLPPGPQRNQRRQTARALRRLFADSAWLDQHVVKTAAATPLQRAAFFLPVSLIERGSPDLPAVATEAPAPLASQMMG